MVLTDADKVHLVRSTLIFMGEKYQGKRAETLIYAIAYQESNFQSRHQIGGPAHGFWQFEKYGGVAGVLRHPSTKRQAAELAALHGFIPTPDSVFQALEHNDQLACIFARLLLWTDPFDIPVSMNANWDYYLRVWRPGKPHVDRWQKSWSLALRLSHL